jgi:preprotein translocase subunit SecG
MERKYLVVCIAILLVFSVGLVGFFLVSNGVPDGLDKTLEEHGAGGESESVWSAPLDYGSNYFAALVMGIVGFFLTLALVYGIVKLRKAIKA